MRVDHNPQVYTVDTITYADLDTKAFMIPHNKVLPSDSVRKADSSSDSRSTYAEITSKPVLVWQTKIFPSEPESESYLLSDGAWW